MQARCDRLGAGESKSAAAAQRTCLQDTLHCSRVTEPNAATDAALVAVCSAPGCAAVVTTMTASTDVFAAVPDEDALHDAIALVDLLLLEIAEDSPGEAAATSPHADDPRMHGLSITAHVHALSTGGAQPYILSLPSLSDKTQCQQCPEASADVDILHDVQWPVQLDKGQGKANHQGWQGQRQQQQQRNHQHVPSQTPPDDLSDQPAQPECANTSLAAQDHGYSTAPAPAPATDTEARVARPRLSTFSVLSLGPDNAQPAAKRPLPGPEPQLGIELAPEPRGPPAAIIPGRSSRHAQLSPTTCKAEQPLGNAIEDAQRQAAASDDLLQHHAATLTSTRATGAAGATPATPATLATSAAASNSQPAQEPTLNAEATTAAASQGTAMLPIAPARPLATTSLAAAAGRDGQAARPHTSAAQVVNSAAGSTPVHSRLSPQSSTAPMGGDGSHPSMHLRPINTTPVITDVSAWQRLEEQQQHSPKTSPSPSPAPSLCKISSVHVRAAPQPSPLSQPGAAQPPGPLPQVQRMGAHIMSPLLSPFASPRGSVDAQHPPEPAARAMGATSVTWQINSGDNLSADHSSRQTPDSNGKSSKAECVRLGVRLVRADLMEDDGSLPSIDPFAAVSCEKHVQTSKAVHNSADPCWDEFFAFEVKSPAFAVLKVKVMDHMRCFRPALVGELRICVQSIADMSQRYTTPTWYQLRNRTGKSKGQVQLQIFYVAERVHRPLTVLCCTWNVGNAQPPGDLDEWLMGVKDSQHDLVAIGVQECAYKPKQSGQGEEDSMFGVEASVTASRGSGIHKSFSGSVAGGASGKEPRRATVLNTLFSPDILLASRTVDSTDQMPRSRTPTWASLTQPQTCPLPSASGLVTPSASSITSEDHVAAPWVPHQAARRRYSALGPTAVAASQGNSPRALRRASATAVPQALVQTERSLSVTSPSGLSRHGSVTGAEDERISSPSASASLARVALGLGEQRTLVRNGSLSAGRPRSAAHEGTHDDQHQWVAFVSSSIVGRDSHRRSLLSTDLTMDTANGSGAHAASVTPSCLLSSTSGPLRGAAVEEAFATALSRAESSSTQPAGPAAASAFIPALPQTRQSASVSAASTSSGVSGPARLRPVVGSPQARGPGPVCEGTTPLSPGRDFSASQFASTLHSPLGTPTGTPLGMREGVVDVFGSASFTGRPQPRDVSLRSDKVLRQYKSRGVGEFAAGGQFKDVWEDHIKDCMGSNYSLVKGAHMGQIRLLLFARNDIYAAITRVERGVQATGVAGVATNKGGVVIGLRIWDTELCFLNSHLAAHQDKIRARNGNYRDIVKGVRIDPHQMDCLTGYHHVFWMGDFNYRLDFGAQATNPTETPTQADFDELVRKVDEGRYDELLQVDQLKKEMTANRVFLGFAEGNITFPPTFKVRRRTGTEYLSQRSPAWADRVLYRSNLPNRQAKVLRYFSATSIASSDHKPVGAMFSVPTVFQDHEDPIDVQLHFSRIEAHGLFVVRHHHRDGAKITNTPPNPCVIFKGPYCLHSDYSTPARKDTRDPVWADPIELKLKPMAEKSLEDLRLMVRVVDHHEGRLLRSKAVQNTLARGVLPLAEAAKLARRGNRGEVTVTIPLEHNGLPAGKLTVVMRLNLPLPPDAKRNSFQASTRSRMSMSAMGRLVRASMAPARWMGANGQEGSSEAALGLAAQRMRLPGESAWARKIRQSLDEWRGAAGESSRPQPITNGSSMRVSDGFPASPKPPSVAARKVRWSVDLRRRSGSTESKDEERPASRLGRIERAKVSDGPKSSD